MIRRRKRCKKMLDLANIQSNSDNKKEDTSIPKYRRVYQKVIKSQPSTSSTDTILPSSAAPCESQPSSSIDKNQPSSSRACESHPSSNIRANEPSVSACESNQYNCKSTTACESQPPSSIQVSQPSASTCEIQPSSNARNKIRILEEVRIFPPNTLTTEPETSGCFGNLGVTPKRRKFDHLNKEEGDPKIYVSPSTGSTYQTLQNVAIHLTPRSKLHDTEVSGLSPYCNKHLNASSTLSRCSSVSDLSCAQYLTCPLNDDQVNEILSNPVDISLAPKITHNESISIPKSDNTSFIDNAQNLGASEEGSINDNTPAMIPSKATQNVVGASEEGSINENTPAMIPSKPTQNGVGASEEGSINENTPAMVPSKPTQNGVGASEEGSINNNTPAMIPSKPTQNGVGASEEGPINENTPAKILSKPTTSTLNVEQVTKIQSISKNISLAPESPRDELISEPYSHIQPHKHNTQSNAGTSNEEVINCNIPARITSNNEDIGRSQATPIEPTSSTTESAEISSSDDSEDEDYSPGSDDSGSSLSDYGDSSSDDENFEIVVEDTQAESNENEWQDISDTVQNFTEYEGNSTINVPLNAETPSDYYKLFVTEEIINKMVQETNNYAQKYINSSLQSLKPKSRFKSWTPTNSEEMKRFLGVLMIMGLVKVPHINDYWSKKSIYKNEYIISIMKRDRFLLLLKCWHFSNSEGTGKLKKVQDVYMMLLDRFQTILRPGKIVVIDESMVPWRGRLQFRQYIKNKSHRYGVKLYKLCTPEGYTFNLTIYTGKGENGREMNHGQKTVMRLIKDLTNEGRVIIADNFYNSIDLAEELLQNKTFLCGTLLPNRRGLPKRVISTKLKKGEIIGSMNRKGVRVIKWVDKRPVYMISTCRRHDVTIKDTGKRRKVSGEEIKKPECVLTYNDSKKGIDFSDQMSSYYTPLKKGLKWFRKVMMEMMFGTALVNSWVVYNWEKEKKMSKKEFCESVIEGFTDKPISPTVAVPTSDVQGVLGKKASLPCDIQPLHSEDAVVMVLWFKEADNEPLYSYDIRSRSYNQPKLWSSPTVFGSRAFFRGGATPAVLMVDSVQALDAGVYRCRVDFKDSPTRNLRVNFTVIIPPNRPTIYDAKRRDRTKLVEPYNEGSNVLLICEVEGGKPRPRVTWYLENVVIDDSYEQRPDGITVNTLTFPNVGRQHLNSRLVCQASNTNLAPPETKVLILDINLKPLTVNILNKEKQISADKRYEVECRTTGSRPEAYVTWWKNNRQLKKIAKNFSENNETLSVLSLVPSMEDDGKYLACRAENKHIEDSAIEDKWRLNVHYVPVVDLKMGSSLNPDEIKEGDDVYFECTVRANPKSHRLHWYHDNTEIFHNEAAGIILSSQSLVLQSVTRAAAGDYTCVAANSEGKGTSNPVSLLVRYAPVCAERRDGDLFGALKHETVLIHCSVDANPSLVSFHWTFNNSGEQTEIPPRLYNTNGHTSTLNYTPTTDMEYGTLACYGSNAVGQQKVPCHFQLVAAGRPFQLQNCSVANQSIDSLYVECVENFDGGLPQWFLMELRELPSLAVQYNVSTNRTPPYFELRGLPPGVSYRIDLYAVNAKGRSDVTTIETVTLKGQAKFTGESSALGMSPVLASIAAMSALLATAVCGVLAVLYRRHSNRHRNLPAKHAPLSGAIYPDRQPQYPTPVKQDPDSRASSTEPRERGARGALLHTPDPREDDADPDIIPCLYADRRPVANGYMSLQRPPSTHKMPKLGGAGGGGAGAGDDVRSEPDGGAHFTDFRKKDYRIPLTSSYHSLGRVNKGVNACSPSSATGVTSSLTAHRLRPEVVTTSHKVQESCI